MHRPVSEKKFQDHGPWREGNGHNGSAGPGAVGVMGLGREELRK